MPLYEFECESCHRRFERIQKSFSDPPPEACPHCGKGPVRKLLSTPAFQFKGSGFYITDYTKKTGEPDTKEKAPAGESKESTATKEPAQATGTKDTGTAAASKTETKKTDTSTKKD